MKDKTSLKVAIVCDWLTTVGGAERVVQSFHEMFPEAPIYTSQYNPEKIDWFKSADVRTGWLNRLPRTMHKFFPLLRVIYFSRLNLRDYDLVISSSGAEAKGVRVRKGAIHINYCHAPTQYYWALYDDYMKNPGFGWLNPFARIALWLIVRPMRFIDRRLATRPDYIVANSTYVQRDVRKYYGRNSTVIFPPVNTEKFAHSPKSARSGFVVLGRQVPWKRIDIAIAACRNLGEKLTVVGNGSEHDALVKIAAGNSRIHFKTTQNDTGVREALTSAEAFLFPSKEPFGITPVEALSAGTPVIAYGEGGALDYIKDGQNGLLFRPQTAASLIEAIKKFRTLSFDERAVKTSAAAFSNEAFRAQFMAFVEKAVSGEKI